MANLASGLEAFPAVESPPVFTFTSVEFFHVNYVHSWVEVGKDLIRKQHANSCGFQNLIVGELFHIFDMIYLKIFKYWLPMNPSHYKF
jgi:hypothetical protein